MMLPETINGLNNIVFILLIMLVLAVCRIIIFNYKQLGSEWKKFKKLHKFDTKTANIIFWVCAICIVAFTILGFIL